MGLRCLAEGKDGAMWFGITEGVMRYDGLQWTTYTTKEGLGGAVETLCAGADGSMYAGGRWGISRFIGGQWKQFLPPAGQSFGAVRRILIARDGALWAATSWGALRCLESQRVLYTGSEGALMMRTNSLAADVRVELLPEAILEKKRGEAPPSNRSDYSEVYEDRQGRIWLGTDSGGDPLFQSSFRGLRPQNPARPDRRRMGPLQRNRRPGDLPSAAHSAVDQRRHLGGFLRFLRPGEPV